MLKINNFTLNFFISVTTTQSVMLLSLKTNAILVFYRNNHKLPMQIFLTVQTNFKSPGSLHLLEYTVYFPNFEAEIPQQSSDALS